MINLPFADASLFINLFTQKLTTLKISGISIGAFLILLLLVKWAISLLSGNATDSSQSDNDNSEE